VFSQNKYAVCRRWSFLLLWPVLIPLLFSCRVWSAQEPDRDALQEEIQANRQLETLYALAQDQKLYVVFHFPHKSIEFHIRGVKVRSIPILNSLVLGRLPAHFSALILRIKETDRPPQREVFDPRKAAEEASTSTTTTTTIPTDGSGAVLNIPDYNNPEFFELKDMPNRFNFVFDTGFAIMFRPYETPAEIKTWGDRWRQWGLWWSDTRARLARRWGKEQVPQLRLILSEEDCRALFWATSEGSKALFITQE